MTTVLSFFALTFISTNAFSQSSYELTCRAKAKEVASETYSSCVTEARNSHIEQIRNNYQKELAALKSKYDKELKKMAPGSAKKEAKAAAEQDDSQPAVVLSPKVKGIAKKLPSKAANQSEAAPIRSVSEGSKVVAVGSDKGAASLEKEASDADQVEIIETPAE